MTTLPVAALLVALGLPEPGMYLAAAVALGAFGTGSMCTA